MSDAEAGSTESLRNGNGRARRTVAERAAFRRRALARTFKVVATVAVVYFLILNIPG